MDSAEGGILIEQARGSEDWRQIRELCGLTGDLGRPIERERWSFFAEYWIGPYERLLPEWTFVARRGGRVAGYLTGCPDTASFAGRRQLLLRLPMVFRALAGEFGHSPDVRRFLKRAFWLERSPGVGAAAAWRALRAFPAHLHVNVREGERGAGAGRRLIDEFSRRLAAEGVSGIHLVCAPPPVEFYRRLGFMELAVSKGPVALHLMGKRVEAT